MFLILIHQKIVGGEAKWEEAKILKVQNSVWHITKSAKRTTTRYDPYVSNTSKNMKHISYTAGTRGVNACSSVCLCFRKVPTVLNVTELRM